MCWWAHQAPVDSSKPMLVQIASGLLTKQQKYVNVGTVFVGRVEVLEEGLQKVGDENNKNDYIDDILKE